jgi:AcrR family transcriptional regulator
MRTKYDQSNILGGTAMQIVDSARRLFNRDGFESVSVDSIMAHSGLTRGGFYSYFDSKSDLYSEVMRCFFTDPDWEHRWEGVEFAAAAEAGPQIVRAYCRVIISTTSRTPAR